MQEETQKLFDKICDPNEKEAFYFAEKLGKINTEEVKDKLIELVKGDNWEIAYLACKALAKTSFNNEALEAIFTAIRDKKNQKNQGAFVQVLEEFDLSESFVDIFRVYLFGNFKAETLAKEYLDSVEFEITPRTIRKAEKHWNHYLHNPEDEGSLAIKKAEVEPMLLEMKELFSE
ncbi:HEAT repeat domain-containing protein [Algoriphagus halophilus]|uniref:HEAT repeat-containing protein n=1 Tax=Algoriphagus halophilus TaxID=226505 RepID=A0A1N6DVS1_9BACT|nr:HEAT repeat domain-containing protein [Algoriphagus halophilus]SIN74898.1 HEAT repeat-containing protein [Algoriphagus halophilus]